MRIRGYLKAWQVLLTCFLLILPVAVNFLAQNAAPSAVPTLQPSPTATASPHVAPVQTPSPTPLPGAQNFHQWGSITVFNGLPSDAVRAIAQTPDGVMWFGTDNGLSRFDGRRVQNFSLGNPEADRISVLKTASTGELWIGTRAGAFIYANGRFNSISGMENLPVTAILLGGTNYLGTETGRLFVVLPAEDGFLTAQSVSPSPLGSQDGKPFVVTDVATIQGRIVASSSGGGVFEISANSVSALATTPRPLFVNAIAVSESGELWFGADAAKAGSGIYLKAGGVKADRIAAPTANVLAVQLNDSGLWAGTERYGLFHIANNKLKKTYTFENTSGGLRSDTIFSLFTDREGVLWIGTNRGVSRFDRLGPVQETVSDSPNGNFIRTLFKSRDGRIYAGSNRGLFVRMGDKWTPVADHANKPIYALTEDRNGKLRIGTTEKMAASPNKTVTTGDTRSFADFLGSKYAAVADVGLVQAGATGNNVVYTDGSVNALWPSGNKLWVGTAGNGLYSFDGRKISLEVSPDTLKSGTIWRIFENSDGVWIAGEHGVYLVRDGMPERIIAAEEVRDVFVEGENVWAATTTRGLLHARRDARFGWLVSTVGFEQGLPSEKAFSILSTEEGLLIATNRGVVTYRPGTTAPKIIATRVLSQRVHDLADLGSTIPLDYPQNTLLIEVAGQSSRTFPEEFQYAFVLKNGNDEVIDSRISNEPQFAPADLKPDSYVVEVTAFDRDLLASDPLVIRFSVAKAPFPWTATALGILLAIAVIALIWAIVERRRIVIRNRELAAARLELANEAERERSRIARDLHDQTLADLRGLIMKSDKELPPDAGFREEIESISTEVRRICEDLSPSVLENVGLIASLEFLLGHTIDNYKFDAGEATNEEIELPMNVQLQIYRIAQEVLANINQHAGAKLVQMKVAVPGPYSFEMSIENDGAKFTPPEQSPDGGRGIAGIRSRAALINADAEWSELGMRGQRFTLGVDASADRH